MRPQEPTAETFERGHDPMPPLVSAVMPCLNEARTLPVCIRKAQEGFRAAGIRGEVVVADNGSTDGSIEIALGLGARVISESRRGYGSALQAGIAAARGEIVVMADSDDSYDWREIGRFVEKVRQGFDLVMGNRFKGGIEDGAMPLLHRYLGNPVLSAVSRIAFDVPIGDFHCGMRAFTRSAYERMRPRTTGMEFATEMIANGARCGLRIAEIPVKLHKDQRDRPPHLRSFRDGWRHLRFIVSYAPDYLYLWPGGICLAVGTLLQALLARGPLSIGGVYVGIHFLVLGGLLSVVGLNVIVMGVLAKLAVQTRHPAYQSRFLARLRKSFRLEWGLIAGGALSACGLAVNAWILRRWLALPPVPMGDTVHPALVATNAIALGAIVIFSSFLLHLLLTRDDAEPPPSATDPHPRG